MIQKNKSMNLLSFNNQKKVLQLKLKKIKISRIKNNKKELKKLIQMMNQTQKNGDLKVINSI